MNFINRRLYKMLSYIVIILLGIGAFIFFSMDYLMELWWFTELGYEYYFLLRDGYLVSLLTAIILVFAPFIFLNFLLAARITQSDTQRSSPESGNGNENWLKTLISSRAIRVFIPLSLLLTIPLLIPVALNWESVLLYFFSSKSGVVDPVYGKDISFYLFSYPVYKLVNQELLITFSLLFTVIAIFYWRRYKKSSDQSAEFSLPGKIHLTSLILLIVLVAAWSISLERIDYLYESRHEPVFFGPGFVEMNYGLPLIWLTFIAFLGAAIAAVYYIFQKKGIKYIVGFALACLIFVAIKNTSWLPGLIEKIYIKPNPVKAEGKYIQFNIDATLNAFALDQVEQIDFPALSSLNPHITAKISDELYNVPVWDNDLLLEVYEELQTIRPFFRFFNVAVDRYMFGGREHQVNIGARELSINKLPEAAKTWNNKHLIYTHGYGAVVTPSQQTANQPPQWLLQNINLSTRYEKFKIERPEIFYGLADYSYAIVPNNAPTNFRTADRPELNPDYFGSGGLKISSLLRKLIVATFIRDKNIFFANSITDQSKILLRRNIFRRIKTITPFLQLDSSPYPVIVNNKIYWIMDAYTTSNLYPVVKPVSSPFKKIDETEDPETLNFVRNSVKIIVDAYNGSVDYYIVDEQAPIIRAYQRAYPFLFKNIAEMPEEFVKHLSYPQQLFTLQMQIYARFHQTDPEVFYQQSDALEFAQQDGKPMLPYYLIVDPLEKPTEVQSEYQNFILVSPMSPIGRENLRMVAVAGCMGEQCNKRYSAEIEAYNLPLDVQIDGPAQINAIINQTPEISRQFTLWGQRGSRVIRGRMIIMPVEKTIIYIQPIYLRASSQTKFPQLVRVVAVLGQHAAMDTSLQAAFQKLQKKINEQGARALDAHK
jgi:uncharacterized protein